MTQSHGLLRSTWRLLLLQATPSLPHRMMLSFALVATLGWMDNLLAMLVPNSRAKRGETRCSVLCPDAPDLEQISALFCLLLQLVLATTFSSIHSSDIPARHILCRVSGRVLKDSAMPSLAKHDPRRIHTLPPEVFHMHENEDGL